MSSEKHANLGLHKWAPTDGVLRTEFNDNFGKIDEKVAEKAEKVDIGDLSLIPQATVVDALKDKDDKITTVNVQLADTAKVIGVNLEKFPLVIPEADDTARIRRAINTISVSPFTPTNGSIMTPSVVFNIPAGRYKISDEITFNYQFINIKTDSDAIIEQTTPGKRIFVFPNIFKLKIRGLTFLKGTNALYMSNANLDKTIFDIDKCEFQLQSDYAVYTMGLGYPAAPTDVHMSANLTFRKCKFVKPKKILFNVCDNAVLDDCWVSVESVNFDDDSAAFCNHLGVLRFNKMFGIPKFGSMTNVRWIDNYDGDVIINESRFGAEDGGIPIVYQFGPRGAGETTYPFQGTQIIIENSWTYSGQSANPNAGLIVLMTSVPQYVRIQGNKGVIRPYFVNKGNLDLANYFNGLPIDRFKFILSPNSTGGGGDTIIEELKPYVVTQDSNKLFPIGAMKMVTTATAGQAKKTFNIPTGQKTFTAILTVSAQQGSGSTLYRLSSSYIIQLGTAYNGTAITDFLNFQQIFAPVVGPHASTQNPPTIVSLHFGNGDTGTPDRPNVSGGQFTVVINNSNAVSNASISIVPLHNGI